MICSAQTALKQIRLRLAPSSSRRCYSAGRGPRDAKVSNVPSDEERKAEHIRISKQIQSEAQHGDEKKAPLRMEELNPFYWTVSSGPGWSGARSRVDEKEQSRFYKLSFKDRSNPSIGAQVQTLMEITDPVLFCTAPQNEIDLEELGSTVVDWDDLESMISKGATHRPVAVTTTVEAMLGDVKVDDAFSPTEELEKIISDAFSDITVPVNFTAAALPSDQVEFDGIEEVTLRDQLRGRNLATINAIYERAGFPYRWYSETDMELQDALKYLRDVNGHIVDAGWSNADILLVEVDPTTSLIKQPLNIVMFIELKTPQVLNMIGQAIHAIRPRDHVLTGPRKKNSQQKRSSRTKGEKLITQIGFEFWASGASLACLHDGRSWAIAYVEEEPEGKRLNIRFSPVIAGLPIPNANTQSQKSNKRVSIESLRAVVERVRHKEREMAKRRLDKAERQLQELEATQSRARLQEAQAACYTAKGEVDQLHSSKCYVSSIYRRLNSYGLLAALGIYAVRYLRQRHARHLPSETSSLNPGKATVPLREL